jgi:hypothetical protein
LLSIGGSVSVPAEGGSSSPAGTVAVLTKGHPNRGSRKGRGKKESKVSDTNKAEYSFLRSTFMRYVSQHVTLTILL